MKGNRENTKIHATIKYCRTNKIELICWSESKLDRFKGKGVKIVITILRLLYGVCDIQ